MSNQQTVANPILAVNPSVNVSSRYKFVSTQDIINELGNYGYTPKSTSVARVRKLEKQGFQKHVIRFQGESVTSNKLGVTPEVVLRASHCGDSAFEMFYGVYRVFCANGIVAGSEFSSLRFIHTGKGMENMSERMGTWLNDLPRLMDTINNWSTILPTKERVALFNDAATGLALNTDPEVKRTLWTNGPYRDGMLRIRRNADTSPDAWTLFNRAQEALAHGNVPYTYTNSKGEVATRFTRAIKSPTRLLSVNRELWDLANDILVA